ncbi:MAG: hypothetical protein ABI597_07425 [Gammaproteobacteria bacterium]
MTTSPENIIEQNWEKVKQEMHKAWRNLSEVNINKINNYGDLVKQLKKAYDISDEDVEEKIHKFIDKFDLQPQVTGFLEFKNYLSENAEATKEKLEEWSNSAVNYSKENPLKILGLGVLAAVAIKKMLK